jgi:hypothetical protein
VIARPGRAPRRRPVWQRGLLLLLLGGLVRLAWDLTAHWDQLHAGGLLRTRLLLALRCGALAAGLGALLLAALRAAPAQPEHSARRWLGLILQGGAYVLLFAVAVASLVQLSADLGGDRFAVTSAFRSGLLLAASVWIGLLAVAPRRMTAASRGPARVVGVGVVNVLLLLLALEAATLLMAHAFPTRLLWNESSARSTIEANRLAPGRSYLGFPANSRGYYDEEFFAGGRDDFVVALVADSFGVGIVPQRYNFATVAERRLRRELRLPGRVAVHNYGVAAIGMPEYAWLVENEVPLTSPARVLLCLFVGNDISGLAARDAWGYYSLQQLKLFKLVRRLFAVRHARLLGADGAAGRGPPGRPSSDGEGGTFDRQTFLEIERASVELCNTRSGHMERLYRASFAWLGRLHRRTGDRLLVVLIPDEYQMNDELYDALMQRVPDPSAYDRLLPQKRLEAHCRRRGIEVLDLLPPLRRANEERPVYRLRDTHWNVRGNRVAGIAIASYLLGRRPDLRRGSQPEDGC